MVEEAAVAAELTAAFNVLSPDQEPQRTACDKSGGERVFAGGGFETFNKVGLCVCHRAMPFKVSLTFSSCRTVSRGARLLASSRLRPTMNNMPAIAAAMTAATK